MRYSCKKIYHKRRTFPKRRNKGQVYPAPYCGMNHLLVLVVVIHDLIVGVVVLLAAVGVAAGLLAAHVGIALGRLLLIQLLAHLIEQLGQLLEIGRASCRERV